jgi:hypothetical protein
MLFRGFADTDALPSPNVAAGHVESPAPTFGHPGRTSYVHGVEPLLTETIR